MPDATGTRPGVLRDLRHLETDRLRLRRLTQDDAPFILRLLNEPSWHRYIGDKGVRTLEEACAYLREGPLAMYERAGIGLLRVGLQDGDVPIGICGLIRRLIYKDTLPDVDIGFALFPEHCGCGYAFEAARAVLDFGFRDLGLTRIVAITTPDNVRSIRLLERIGLAFEKMIEIGGTGEEIALYAAAADSVPAADVDGSGE